MINPSASGWIDKFFSRHKPDKEPVACDAEQFYARVRATGFLYGHLVSFDTPKPVETKGLTEEERTKLGLLITLFHAYGFTVGDSLRDDFVGKAMAFYREMLPQGPNLLKKVLAGNSESGELEEVINQRVRTNQDIISRNFSNIVTNALLFEDVLAFRQYLLLGTLPHNYLKKLEETIGSIVTLALKAKAQRSEYDELLVRMFDASVRYTKFSEVDIANLDTLDFSAFTSQVELWYFFDMAVMSMWSDGVLEAEERNFLTRLADLLGIEPGFREESIRSADAFVLNYKKEIPYFNYSNPVKHFYDQATQSVMLLISRNKNRLLKELGNNGELVMLLTHSTHRSLDAREKKKVKKQLLEICKTVPSLAIFLLPGGSLLLPLLVKFIPQMLPSAFNENLEDE